MQNSSEYHNAKKKLEDAIEYAYLFVMDPKEADRLFAETQVKIQYYMDCNRNRMNKDVH